MLVLDDGSALFDSPVILEYLDHLAGGGKIIPKDPKARFDALRLQALADGIMDASILIVYEGRYRPAEKHEQKWLDLQSGKVDRGLAALEAAPPGLDSPPNVGQITLACALGYREFRFPGTVAQELPAAVRLARYVCGARAVVRGDQAAARVELDRCACQKKKPRTVGPGLFVLVLLPRSEPEVDAAAHEMGAEPHVVRIDAVAAGEAAVELAEIDIEIFGLRGPVAGDHEFDAAADGPAGIGVVGAGEARLARADVADRETAGDERQEAVEPR